MKSGEKLMCRIYVSSVLPAPADRVWEKIRDFNALPLWHPMVKFSEIENGLPCDQVGCVRHFILQDGGDLRERLLALSDQERTFTYSILESPLPVANYVATVRLQGITDGDRTFAEWSAEFDVTAGPQADVIELVTGVFQGGFDSLKKHFG
jgi:hypothetical protein